MNKRVGIALLSMCLVLAGCGQGEDHSGHDHSGHDHSHDHSHGQIDVSDQENPPGLVLSVTPDQKGGWNLNLALENFQFAPQNVNQAHVAGEGHAHLYIDGHKITRLYGEWYFIDALEPGEHEVRVTLNANDHSDLVFAGEPVADTVKIVQP